VLTNLRKLCNHPALFRSPDGEDAGAAGDGEEGSAGEAFDPDQSGKCKGWRVPLCAWKRMLAVGDLLC